MPRFHFNVHDGVSQPDCEGIEFSDLKTALDEAVRVAGALIRDDARGVIVDEGWRMDLTNEIGLVLFQLSFQVSETAATLGYHSRHSAERQRKT